uniref:signal-transducing adaptor protein 1-like isoform X2 n=1 Tax=Pristiophorus japonicus TaxID=55135 RepID=UPI00398F4CD4
MSTPIPTRHRAFVKPGYYEGYLEKLESKSKSYKRYWTVLRGNDLYFQVTSRNPMYIEKISLDDFVSVVNEDSKDENLQGASLIIKLKHGDVKLKADSSETREQWKGFIYTVAKLEIPNLDLLPGQIQRLKEVLEEEMKPGRKSAPALSPPRSTAPELVQDCYDDVENNFPRCYYKLSRVEAELMLERNMEYGNLLMRPGSDNKNISITTRQMFNNTALVKHYRIRCADNGYIIEIDCGILCCSMQEVIDYFVQHTSGVLKPLERSTDYEINLSFVQKDAESGEMILRKQQAPPQSLTHQPEIQKLKEPKIQALPKKMLTPPHPKTRSHPKSCQSNTLPVLGLTHAHPKPLFICDPKPSSARLLEDGGQHRKTYSCPYPSKTVPFPHSDWQRMYNQQEQEASVFPHKYRRGIEINYRTSCCSG